MLTFVVFISDEDIDKEYPLNSGNPSLPAMVRNYYGSSDKFGDMVRHYGYIVLDKTNVKTANISKLVDSIKTRVNSDVSNPSVPIVIDTRNTDFVLTAELLDDAKKIVEKFKDLNADTSCHLLVTRQDNSLEVAHG